MKKFCAHRGVSNLMPENTLPAFAAALVLGADEIEFDVRLTKDQKLIVSHDGTLDSISDGQGELKNYTLSELKKLNVGLKHGWVIHFCTPEEVFEQFANKMTFNIHLKEHGENGYLLHELLKLIEKYESNGRVVKKGVTYNSFAEAYALGIYLMQQKYADVEILCLTLIQNYTSGLTATRIASFNRVISAVATYLGATVIDQSGELSELNFSNSYMYSSSTDSECVHPGVSGHALMERLIVKTLAKKHNIAFTE